MSAKLIGRFVHDSPEWHAARADGIGGSDIAAVLGLSTYESRYSLWHRKAGLVEDQPDTDLTRRGHWLEPSVAAWFADQHPEYGLRTTGTWCHERRPWQRANPDRLLTRPRGRKPTAILECKTDHESWKWGEPGTEAVPIYYRVQVMWYLDVFGLDVAHIAVLLGGLKFAEYRIEYDVNEAALLRDAALEFLESITNGQPPDIDEHAQTYQVIRELHPDIDDREAEIDPGLAVNYISSRRYLDDAKEVEQKYRSQVADATGNARRAVCNGHTIATRQAKNGGTPFVVAARNLPDPEDLHREDEAA